jgi:PAS domain S-box-containing protein
MLTHVQQFLYRPQIFDGLWESTAILVVDLATGEIMAASPPLTRMFGYQGEELFGQNVDVLVPDAHRAAHGRHRTEYAASRRLRRMGAPGMALKGQRKDGSTFPVAIQLSPKSLDDRDVVIGIVVDMTGGEH